MPVPYEPYGSAHPPSHPTDTVYDPYLHAPTIVRPHIPYRSATQEPILEFKMLGAAPQDSSCSTHGYSRTEYSVSFSDPYILGPADRVFEGDRVVGEEQERRGDDDGDSGNDDQDEGDDDGDEERPRHGKGKSLTGSFMLVMSKIARSHNKRPEVARDVPAPTQKRKKVKASDWEQTGAGRSY
ncbi:hypothetical protein M9H77_16900 [Catharanthus roseus]|uniref:Uncharacterized protein n=1 Tax=Catharanthus roseus TaxID=4058 RepID=A0ACC0B324_CATRO|nr:hypothetical protein M9H77_16900 [Catharanthus roseus]